MSAGLVAAVMAAGAGAGGLGALLGIGGGVFLVPFLTLALGVPIRQALATSLITVIATSSAILSGAGRELINLRLALLIAVLTIAGSLAGGALAGALSPFGLHVVFSAATLVIALVMLTRLEVRNVILDPNADPGTFGSRYFDAESGRGVAYQVRRMPVVVAGSFVAGNLSMLLGVGGGIVTVPLLNTWCGVPIRAAAATSAFTLGVTATTGGIIYYGRGDVVPVMAAAAVLGVQVGSWLGLRIGARANARALKILLATVLLVVSVLMMVEA
jgi:uncharacterized membrane protein YfcA